MPAGSDRVLTLVVTQTKYEKVRTNYNYIKSSTAGKQFGFSRKPIIVTKSKKTLFLSIGVNKKTQPKKTTTTTTTTGTKLCTKFQAV